MNSEIIASLLTLMVFFIIEPVLFLSALYLKKKDIIKGSDFKRSNHKYLSAVTVANFFMFCLFFFHLLAAIDSVRIITISTTIISAFGYAFLIYYANKYFVNEFFGVEEKDTQKINGIVEPEKA